jgi:ribosome biogenesis GTPase
MRPPRKHPFVHKDLTRQLLTGQLDEDRVQSAEQFGERSAGFQQRKMERTALLRAAEGEAAGDIESLPRGQVVQVYSLYSEVEAQDGMRLCVVRKTLARLGGEGMLVVGDVVGFRDTGMVDEQGRPEAVIEVILPRRTVLTRANSFNAARCQPIVANADQMLIVVSIRQPRVKWGLVDRMLVAAQAASLRPIVCLNKTDLAAQDEADAVEARAAMDHYRNMGHATVWTSAFAGAGLDELRHLLGGQTTVVAGHSGVGKSSLLNAIQLSLNLRTQAVSGYNEKGRHTTSSSRRLALEGGGHVIDTPGIKHFGLWGVTRENLIGYFPDVEAESAPVWRGQSYQRILRSLPEMA